MKNKRAAKSKQERHKVSVCWCCWWLRVMWRDVGSGDEGPCTSYVTQICPWYKRRLLHSRFDARFRSMSTHTLLHMKHWFVA